MPFAVKNKTESAENFNGTLTIFSVNIDSGCVSLATRVSGGNTYADMLLSKDDAAYSAIYGSAINSNSRLNFGIHYITSA